jgi:hypothetical protein
MFPEMASPWETRKIETSVKKVFSLDATSRKTARVSKNKMQDCCLYPLNAD